MLFLLGLVSVSTTGCAPAQLSPHVARSMVDLRQDLAQGKTKIESTTAILSDLLKNPRQNTSRQVEFYNQEMKGLEEVAQRVRDTNTQMQANAGEYFDKWESELGQVQNKEIAAAGTARREASIKAVERVREKLDAAKDVVSPFLSNLRDINRYMQQDMTADGVIAIQPVMRKTLQQKQAALRSIDEVIATIDQVTKGSQ